MPDEPDPIDMVPLAPNDSANSAASANEATRSGKKLCRVCGKDLTGRSRLKDEKGYICKKCSDAEFAVEAEAERDSIECPECHRKLKAGGFVEWRGTLICRRCHAHHLDNDRLKVPKVELKQHAEFEKKRTMQMAIVAGVIGLGLLVKTVFFGW